MRFTALYALREMHKRPGWFLTYGFLYGILLFAYGGYLLFLAQDKRSLYVGGGLLFPLFLLLSSILFTALFRQKYRHSQAEYRILEELGMQRKQIVEMQWLQLLPVLLTASLVFPAFSWLSILWYRQRLIYALAAFGRTAEVSSESVMPFVWMMAVVLILLSMLISRHVYLHTDKGQPKENRFARRYTMEQIRREPSMETYRKIHLDRTKPSLRRLTAALLFLHLLPVFALLIPMSYGFFTGPDMDHGYDLSITKESVDGDPYSIYIPQSVLDAILAVEGVSLSEVWDLTEMYTKRFGPPENAVYGGIKLNLPEENWQDTYDAIMALPCITDAYRIQNALQNELITEARYGVMQDYTLLLAFALLLASFCGTLLLLKNQLEERRSEFLTLARLGLVKEDCWHMVCRTYCGKLTSTGLAASSGIAVLYILLDLAGGDIFKLSTVFRLGGAAAVYIFGIVLLASIALLRELKPVFAEAYPVYIS